MGSAALFLLILIASDRTQPENPLPHACRLSGGLQESIARCYKASSIYCVTFRSNVL
ncbi:hypothetical protein MicvaDRAFT_4074 [Microcoleus vaginatus FGP-2]|nr:hypothetical protein MicvaDRAFT_4074 [Microcoleus vaginatus FGP-2]